MKLYTYGALVFFFSSISTMSFSSSSIVEKITVSQSNNAFNGLCVVVRQILPFMGCAVMAALCGAAIYDDEEVKKSEVVPGVLVCAMLSTLISVPLPEKYKIVPYVLIFPCLGALNKPFKGAVVASVALMGYFVGAWANIKITGN